MLTLYRLSPPGTRVAPVVGSTSTSSTRLRAARTPGTGYPGYPTGYPGVPVRFFFGRREFCRRRGFAGEKKK
eukprot:3410500-Rhodomonas_salina.1